MDENNITNPEEEKITNGSVEDIKEETSENAEETIDEVSEDLTSITDEEEIKKVEEMLKSSKSKRKKIMEGTDGKESTAKEKGKFGLFIDKCIKNPVIPVTGIAAIAVLVFGIIYFGSIIFPVDSLGFTYEDLQSNYIGTATYQNLFIGFDCALPDITYSKDTTSKYKNKLNFFAARIDNTFSETGIAVQGSTRKTDDEIVALRFLFEIPENESDLNSDKVFYFYEMVLGSVFPETPTNELDQLLSEAASTQEFKTKDNVAYRFTKQSIDGHGFYVMDFAPASNQEELK